MSRRVGSWWITDGVDGRRIEAQGFGSRLNGLAEFAWTEDHGDTGVLERDLVDGPSRATSRDSVAVLVMASHGAPDGFAVCDGFVSIGDSEDFAKSDVEVFVAHAGGLLEHTPDNSVGRWIPAFGRLRYMLGFHNTCYSGGGQDPRGELFATYAAWLHYTTGLFDMSLREAWAEANEIVEGPEVEWAYLRATSPESDTYQDALRAQESPDPVSDRVFYTARGSC